MGPINIAKPINPSLQNRKRSENRLLIFVLFLLILLLWAAFATRFSQSNKTVSNSTLPPVNSSKENMKEAESTEKPKNDDDIVEKPDAEFEMQERRSHSKRDEHYHRRRVNKINNNPNSTWKAKYSPIFIRARPMPFNFFENMTKAEIDEMAKEAPEEYQQMMAQDTEERVKYLQSVDIGIPTNFDARLRWPSCWATHQIYDQAGCGSCWAVAATSVMSDRVCISSNVTYQIQISAEDLTACCHDCGGCRGNGNSLKPFVYWKEQGIVSGGSFGTHTGCRPYSLEPCRYPCERKKRVEDPTPSCERKCIGEYGKEYQDDITKSLKAYWLRATTPSYFSILPRVKLESLVGTDDKAYVTLIQKEILLNGPVVGCLNIHEDFQYYESGIYSARDLSSPVVGGHCSKLLGWGEDNGAKYWLYANSWGRNFAEYGFYRIAFDESPLDVVAGHI